MPISPQLLSLPAPSRRFLILLVALLLGLGVVAYWLARPLVRSFPAQAIPGAPRVVATWLPDGSNKGGLTIAQIAALDQAGAFEPMPDSRLVPVLNSHRLDGRWFAFRIHNGGDSRWETVLDMAWQNYDRATLYQLQAGGRWARTVTGESVSSGDPERSSRVNAFGLALAPGETVVLYLHVEDYTRLPTQFQLWESQGDFLQWEQFELAKTVGFFCLLLPLVAYGLFAYATLHQRDQLYYVWGVLLSLAYRVCLSNTIGGQLSWLVSPWKEMVFGSISILILICACRFTRSFFELGRHDPVWDRRLACVQWGLLVCLFLLPCPLWPGTAFVTLMTILVISSGVYVVLFWVGVRRWFAGAGQAPFFVAASAVFLAARVPFLIKGPDTLVRYDEQTLIHMLCSCFGLLVLALANAYRHRLVLVEHLTLRSGYTERLENEVTERTRILQALSERLAATVAERDRILAIIGHDLRGPALSLQSLTHILANEAAQFTPDQLGELARDIDQACAQQLEMLDGLLVWGGTQSGHRRNQSSGLDVHALVAASLHGLAQQAKNKGILLFDATLEGLIVNADQQLVQMILRNLLANSFKFTRSGGRIEVVATISRPGWWELRVTDTGVGIASDRLATLFTGLTESTRGTQDEPGAGIGLSLCRDLARAGGGDLCIESIEGRGTTAILTLPTGH